MTTTKKETTLQEPKKLSFNKRISLVKKGTLEALIKNSDMENIPGASTTGYFPLRSIFEALNPLLDNYNLDIDLEIKPKEIVGHWYNCDCSGEGHREIHIDFAQLENVQKLSLMKNIVQSNGAVKTYIRRYALTNMLNLHATDIIESQGQGQGNKKIINRNQQQQQQLNRLKRILYLAMNKDDKKVFEELTLLTKFNDFKGYDNFGALSNAMLPKVLKNAEDKFREIVKKIDNKNTQKPSQKETTNKNNKNESPEKTIIAWTLLNISNKDNDKASKLLKDMAGESDINKLSTKDLEKTFVEVKNKYPKAFEKMAEAFENREREREKGKGKK